LLLAASSCRFFEQGAQSMSPWSLDGSAAAYSRMNEDGERGI
jgi:hypothetical protein